MLQATAEKSLTTKPSPRAPGDKRLTLMVLGGCPDGPNNGVSALGFSAAKGLAMAFPEARILIQTYTSSRTFNVPMAGQSIRIEGVPLHSSERLRHRYGTRHVNLLLRCVRWLPRVRHVDVFFDISGGDSFSEIYGLDRFRRQAAVKWFAIEQGKPLVLLPQTYGPFRSEGAIAEVRRIVSRSALVATRDADGAEELANWIGPNAVRRVTRCPDLAFFLDPEPVPLDREPILRERREGEVLVGLNVSSLLWNGANDFGIKFDYRQFVCALVRRLLARSDVRVVLVPHVMEYAPSAPGHGVESRNGRQFLDTSACREAAESIAEDADGRLGCVIHPYGPAQIKFLIGQCEFFIGARMHSCIAAISQGIPCAVLAYSKKARGVLKQLTIDDLVVDLRERDLDGCVRDTLCLFDRREQLQPRVQKQVKQAKQRIVTFFLEELRPAVMSALGLQSPGPKRGSDARGREQL